MKPKSTISEPRPKPTPTSIEIEIAALATVVDAMKSLDEQARQRVLSYVKARFSIYLGAD